VALEAEKSFNLIKDMLYLVHPFLHFQILRKSLKLIVMHLMWELEEYSAKKDIQLPSLVKS